MTWRVPSGLRWLRRRSSCRRFRPDEVTPRVLDEVLSAATCVPTSFGMQPYAFLVVRDPATRAALAAVAGGQAHVAEAPVFVVVCTDLLRVEELADMPEQLRRGEHGDALTSSVIDASLAGMGLSMAAESVGLGTVMVGGVRNDPDRVVELLGLPTGVFPLFGLCVGWPAATDSSSRPRLDESRVVHRERYGAARGGLDHAAMVSAARGRPSAAELARWDTEIRNGTRALHRRRPSPWEALAPGGRA